MKKVIVTEDIIRILKKEQSFLDRSGFMLLPAGSNEDVLAVHKKEKADLIVASLDSTPGISGRTSVPSYVKTLRCALSQSSLSALQSQIQTGAWLARQTHFSQA